MESVIDELKNIKDRQDRIVDEIAKHSEEEEYYREKQKEDDEYMDRLYREGKN